MLKAFIERRLSASETEMKILIAPEDGQGLAWAYAHASVRARKDRADGTVELKLSVPDEKQAQFLERFPGRTKARLPAAKGPKTPRSRHRKLPD